MIVERFKIDYPEVGIEVITVNDTKVYALRDYGAGGDALVIFQSVDDLMVEVRRRVEAV